MTTDPPTQDRMAGAYEKPRCPVCRAAAGPDCADMGHDAKHRRRVENRAVRRYTDTVVKDEAAAVDADNDPSDCRHGCNGDCVASGGSDRCNFTCHPHLRQCPRCDRVCERHEFHDHENMECGGYWACTRCAYMDTFKTVGCADE